MSFRSRCSIRCFRSKTGGFVVRRIPGVVRCESYVYDSYLLLMSTEEMELAYGNLFIYFCFSNVCIYYFRLESRVYIGISVTFLRLVTYCTA